MRVYTIGHSNKPFEDLVERLKRHGVVNLIDVRSKPFSRYNPQFNHMELRDRLPLEDISYRFKGHQLGGMPDDDALKTGGRPDYKKIRASFDYRVGLSELIERELPWPERAGASVLMCSEQDPINCHRRRLIGEDLVQRKFELVHILKDGSLLTEYDLRERLGENQPTIFDMFGGD